MNWTVYPSLVKESQVNKLPDGPYIVTEKVHGSSMAYEIDGEGMFRCYSRNKELDENTVFIPGYRDMLPSLEKSLRIMSKGLPIVVYGELYGRYFPNRNGRIDSVSPVQTGICYSPNLEFIAFDVKRVDRYLEFMEAQSLCRSAGIDFVDILFSGTLEEVKTFVSTTVNTFVTTLQRTGSENTPYHQPIAEGYVFRHLTKHYLAKYRSIAYHEVVKRASNETVIESADDYITMARFNNVRSKRTEQVLTKDTIDEWVTVFMDDISNDMANDGLIFCRKAYKKKCSTFVWNVLRKTQTG